VTCRDDDILYKLHIIDRKLDQIMSAQSDVNAAVAALSSFLADLAVAVDDIKAELAGVEVDTSALDELVAKLPGVQASVDALESAPSTSTSTSTSTSASTATHVPGADPATGLAPGLV
jgi:multidrug efflux pump subunit AcrA (membrane-fusion protein)